MPSSDSLKLTGACLWCRRRFWCRLDGDRPEPAAHPPATAPLFTVSRYVFTALAASSPLNHRSSSVAVLLAFVDEPVVAEALVVVDEEPFAVASPASLLKMIDVIVRTCN